MWMTRVAINHPVFATMVMVALSVLGIFSYQRLRVEAMPEIQFPFVSIYVAYPGASPEQIENAFRILSSDPSVKAVFINVFGGILRVDRLAEGIISAVKKLGLKLPVVLRAEGTNVEQGKKMLAESGLALVMANDMGEGAEKVVALAKGAAR
jgi:hypothetical protein